MDITYDEFLTRVIDDGIEAARKDYAGKPSKLSGAVAGFTACRGKAPIELRVLLDHANLAATNALFEEREDYAADYWQARCYQAEVEWVCNCVSAMLLNEGQPVIVNPTARGVLRAAEILGVRPNA